MTNKNINRTWLRIQSNIHRIIYQVSNGRIGSQFGAPVLLITTIGRKSGQPRTNPLFYLEDGENWVVVASNAGSDNHPAWWLNLLANPSAQIQIEERHYQVTAYAVTKEEKDRLWPRLLNLFSGYDDYQQMTERVVPVTMLEPNEGQV